MSKRGAKEKSRENNYKFAYKNVDDTRRDKMQATVKNVDGHLKIYARAGDISQIKKKN